MQPFSASKQSLASQTSVQSNAVSSVGSLKKRNAPYQLNEATRAVLATLAPWVAYTFAACIFALGLHNHESTVVAFLFISVVLCVSVLGVALCSKDADRVRGCLLASLCLLCVLVGAWTGFTVYDHFFAHYWFSANGGAYVNVVPTEPATGYADAGKIVFSDESKVDVRRALGYRDRLTYCVAPISDGTLSASVQFWATGMDCCSARGSFTCDDTFNTKARSGFVIRDVSEHRRDQHYYYMKAVRQAEAVFGITSTDPIFVRWVKDPEKMETNYWRTGFGVLLVSVIVALLFCIFVISLIFSSWLGYRWWTVGRKAFGEKFQAPVLPDPPVP